MQTNLLLLALLAFGALAVSEPQNRRWQQCILLLLLSLPCIYLLDFALLQMAGTRTLRYDEWFYLIDQYIGAPSWAIGRFLDSHHALKSLVQFDYDFSPSAIVAAIVATAVIRPARESWRAFGTFLTQAAIAPLSYKMLPASGPKYAFAGFPYQMPQIHEAHSLLLSAAPNCMPSMHTASALLVCFFLRHWRTGRIIGGVHVALTVLATLGLGEHYMIDLIAAVPVVYGILLAWRWVGSGEAHQKAPAIADQGSSIAFVG